MVIEKGLGRQPGTSIVPDPLPPEIRTCAVMACCGPRQPPT